MLKKKLFLLALPIFIILVILSGAVFLFAPNIINAAMTGQSTPSVTVSAGGSITITPTGMAYGSKAAGTHTAYSDDGGHKVALTINTNTTTWDVKISKNQDLTSGGNTIASSNFIYSSVFVSSTQPIEGNLNFYTSQQFGSVGSPSGVVDPKSPGYAADTLVVDVRYDLTIPVTQAAASNYQATHTYTLTAS